MSMVHDSFTPQVVVVQCGADCLAGDPLGSFNLSIRGMGACIESVMKWGLPVLLLGGGDSFNERLCLFHKIIMFVGGYNFSNTARYWAYLTSLVLKQEISTDIPEHDVMPFSLFRQIISIFPLPISLSFYCSTFHYTNQIISLIMNY